MRLFCLVVHLRFLSAVGFGFLAHLGVFALCCLLIRLRLLYADVLHSGASSPAKVLVLLIGASSLTVGFALDVCTYTLQKCTVSLKG